jgi:hypothetical protein
MFNLTLGQNTTKTGCENRFHGKAGRRECKEHFLRCKSESWCQNGTSVEVNQGISASSDPASRAKNINYDQNAELRGPNIASFMYGKEGDGMGILRLENCSLTDLTDLIMEVVDNAHLQPGHSTSGRSYQPLFSGLREVQCICSGGQVTFVHYRHYFTSATG